MPPLPWRRVQPIQPDATYVFTITKLPLRSHRRIPRIMRATWRIVRQLSRSDGLVGYALKADLIHKTFWTMSAWTDPDAQAAFVRSDVHRDAMATLRPQMDRPQTSMHHSTPPHRRTASLRRSTLAPANSCRARPLPPVTRDARPRHRTFTGGVLSMTPSEAYAQAVASTT